MTRQEYIKHCNVAYNSGRVDEEVYNAMIDQIDLFTDDEEDKTYIDQNGNTYNYEDYCDYIYDRCQYDDDFYYDDSEDRTYLNELECDYIDNGDNMHDILRW